MSGFFVTATGTDIGKTYVTAGLVRYLRSQGHPASAIKPVISGFDPARANESDSGILLGAMDRIPAKNEIERISPWRFKAPLSPDMAAAIEGGDVDFGAMVNFCREAMVHAEGHVFVEGVGGIMTPITKDHTVLQWMATLRLPLIVVAGSYLGTISHTLTALDVLYRHDLSIAALIVNESEGSPVPLFETAEAIARFTRGIPTFILARDADSHSFADLARRLALVG